MESELKNQNDLLQQLKSLRAEKELLEKHVFLLNECLSVDELKAKISNLEKKKEMLTSLETVISRLRVEIEPLGYLKSILENKKNQNGSESCNKLESNISSTDMESINVSTSFKTQDIPTASNKTQKFPSLKFDKFTDTVQSVTNSVDKLAESIINDGIIDECMKLIQDQNIPSASTKTQTFSSMKFDELTDTIQTVSNSVGKLTKSIVSDGSFDECVQLLDQYDVLSDHEILIESNVNDLEPQKLIKATLSDDDNALQDKQTATTSTYFDAEGINIQLKNGKTLSVKEHMESSVTVNNPGSQDHDDSSTSRSTKNSEENMKSAPIVDNHDNELHKPSTSKSDDNLEVIHLNPNLNISDLLLKIPQILLQQGINSIKVDEKSNGLLKSVKDITKTLLEESKDTRHGETMVKDDIVEPLSNEISNKSIEPTELSEVSPTPIAKIPGENLCSFNSMDLSIGILRGIYSLGLVNPTALQQRVIVHCLHGRDVIVFAGPGNGRTMTFTIPLLQQILVSKNKSQVTQGLILVPNRDLAIHIQKILLSVGDFLGVTVCIGGDNVPRKLSAVPHIVVGTPAGVSSMISCKSLNTDFIQFVVIDKADEMLTNSHTKLIEEIMGKLSKDKQVTLFASDKLDHILDMYMDTLRDPLVIIHEDEKENESLPKQFFLKTQEEWKLNALCEVIETLKIFKAVIFCNSFDRAQKLSDSLQRLNYGVSIFDLEMNAQNREQRLNLFSSNHLRMIITTDPIKGSMFQQANWIINYDCPINHVSYLDKITKCAKQIKVINFINENDDDTKLAIENHTKSYMISMPLNMVDLFEY